MSDASPPVALSVDNLKVDKVSIWNSDRTSTLVKLTPLLSVLITAVALLVSSTIQVWQNEVGSTERKDTAWRAALEKVSLDDKQAMVAALELQTFFEDKRYGGQAHTLAATILPKISDPAVFDTALYENGGPRSLRDAHYLTIARNITNELHSLYSSATSEKDPNALPKDSTFESFVVHPELFFTGANQQDELRAAQTDDWKLDSVSSILSDTWKHARSKRLSPDLDVSGIVFSGHDFTGVDFRNVDMSGSSFVGDCKVDKAVLPQGVLVLCSNR